MSEMIVNYIHNGKQLMPLIEAVAKINQEDILKKDLLKYLESFQISNDHYKEIIKTYKGSKTKSIYLDNFTKDIIESKRLSNYFHNLGCRGFSYKVYENIKIKGDELLPGINFKIALIPCETIFYPKRIRRYLRRISSNHVKYNGFPSICFAIGRKIKNKCYIFVMQSDIIFNTPPFVREHFRGWRRILMDEIIKLAQEKKCNFVFLPKSNDVLKCSHPFRKPSRVPKIWKSIYDQTADDFKFILDTSLKPTNIQIYKELPPVEVTELYKLKIG